MNTQVYDCTQHPHSHISAPMYSTLSTNGDMTSYISSSPDSQYSTYIINFPPSSKSPTVNEVELANQLIE